MRLTWKLDAFANSNLGPAIRQGGMAHRRLGTKQDVALDAHQSCRRESLIR